MTYSEKLKDPRWQKKRLEILQRDEFCCSICRDATTQLHVHHLKYANEPWAVDSAHLVSLCSDCHSVIEALKIDCDDVIAGIKKKSSIATFFVFVNKESQINIYISDCPGSYSHLLDISESSFLEIISLYQSIQKLNAK